MATTLPEQVRTSIGLLRTHRYLTGREEKPMEERIARVVDAFRRAGTKWALVGAHAVGVLTEPRATADFDFVVEDRKMRAILDQLEADFGPLNVTDIGAAVRVLSLDVDLIRSTTHPLFKLALEDTRSAQDWPIPVPEVLVALKFLSSVNTWRGQDKRRQDVLDLILLYKTIGPDHLDRSRVIELGRQVYPGAERELEQILDRADRGEPITI